jgi:hypothetical protein
MPGLPTKIHWPNRQNIPHQIQEHILAIKNNNRNSGYSNHMLNTGHKYGPITDTMDIIKTHKKGKHLNTLEKYHIHKLYKKSLHMNDSAIEANNPIFKTLQEINNR